MQNQSKSIIAHTLFKSISAVKLSSVNSANYVDFIILFVVSFCLVSFFPRFL